MKQITSLLLIILLRTYIVSGQTDPAAVKVLDKFSGNAQAAPSVSIKFRLITDDLAENKSDSVKGSVIISKDKYYLDLPDNKIWFDGTVSNSYLTNEQELTITKPNKKDNSFQSKPSGIFTMYKKGYKARLVEEKSDSWIIDLYPEDIKSELVRVRLVLGKAKTDLKRLEYKRNDGIVVSVIVSDYNLQFKPGPDTFVFSREKYPDADIIDMR
ncbi:MAG TPA: outer membrane lipoprotein carrier protein LolA [Bacteroidales bacterium]|nr:outer membrane lipoprotein carrier protein LolA [Bacteroidales bacterium]